MHRNPSWMPMPTRSFKQQSLNCKYRAGLSPKLQPSALAKGSFKTPVVFRVCGSTLHSGGHPEIWDTKATATANPRLRQTRL